MTKLKCPSQEKEMWKIQENINLFLRATDAYDTEGITVR